MNQTLEVEVRQRATTAADLFATTTKNAILSMDLASLESFVNELVKNPDITYARVLDMNNEILAENGMQSSLDHRFKQDVKLSDINDGVFDTYSEVRESEILYGSVEVGLSIENVLFDLKEARSKIIRIAIFEVFLSIFLSVLLVLYLSKRLKTLQEASERITAGYHGYQIETKGKDEIGVTARAFNQMSSHLEDLLKEINTKNIRLEEEIEKRQEAESELQKAYRELENRVAERTKQLKSANKQLKIEIDERSLAEQSKRELEKKLQRSEKMEALGELAGGVAHDLNNVLSGITTYPELLLLNMDQEDPLRKPLETIQTSGKKATVIVQDLLTLARRGIMSLEVFNINSMVTEYLDSHEHIELLSRHPRIHLKTNLMTDLMNIEGSMVHLSKTLMNLVVNAFESIVDEGSVLIKTENRFVEDAIRGYDEINPGDYIVLSIIDEGKGISSEDQERMFEPFFSRKSMGRSSGTGLGLSVVWGTVKDHNGYISVTSQLNKGTEISLFFPASRKAIKSESPDLSMISAYHGDGEKILIVDDVHEQLEIASAILEKLGYVVDVISSGEEALIYLKEKEVDLVILDMVMKSGMDGLDTYKKIISTQPDQKTIIASGFSKTDRIIEALSLGVDHHIKKPYTIKNIGYAVQKILKDKQ